VLGRKRNNFLTGQAEPFQNEKKSKVMKKNLSNWKWRPLKTCKKYLDIYNPRQQGD
jgi:hypothetical protein